MGLTVRRGEGERATRICLNGRGTEDGKECAVEFEGDVGFVEDGRFDSDVIACTSVHTIAVPLLDLLHVPNGSRRVPSELLELVERQTRAVLQPIHLSQLPLDKLTTAQISEIAYVRMGKEALCLGRTSRG